MICIRATRSSSRYGWQGVRARAKTRDGTGNIRASRTSPAGAGGLISCGANLEDLFRRAALYVDKILEGAKRTDLRAEQPTSSSW